MGKSCATNVLQLLTILFLFSGELYIRRHNNTLHTEYLFDISIISLNHKLIDTIPIDEFNFVTTNLLQHLIW